MRAVMYVFAVLFLCAGLVGLVAHMAAVPSAVPGVVAVAGLAAGVGLLVMAGRYPPSARKLPEWAPGAAMACSGFLLAGGSFYTMLPYFTGESCSVALLAAPWFIAGLVLTIVGTVMAARSIRSA